MIFSCCHKNNCCIVCTFYADDILLLSASVAGLQALLNVCDQSISDLSLKFNCRKSLGIAFGPKHDTVIADMKLGESTICWSSSIKYLGLPLLSSPSVVVDDTLVKRKCYARCNEIQVAALDSLN